MFSAVERCPSGERALPLGSRRRRWRKKAGGLEAAQVRIGARDGRASAERRTGEGGGSMIKADIIDLVHEKIGFSRHESAEVVEATLDLLKEALQKGERVQIVGFGSFVVRPKKERVGRNPKTGEEIVIAPRKVLTFKPSKILRDSVNNGGVP
jgi:integration host factor subunit alpha